MSAQIVVEVTRPLKGTQFIRLLLPATLAETRAEYLAKNFVKAAVAAGQVLAWETGQIMPDEDDYHLSATVIADGIAASGGSFAEEILAVSPSTPLTQL